MPPDGTIARTIAATRLRGPLGGILIFGLVLGVFVAGAHPGVSTGDTAELQMAAPLSGICHPPGYQTEVTLGGLFCRLPIADGVARRLNLLMAVCGAIGCLALYGSVLRVTGGVMAGLVAASTLAFSVTYWTFSLITEAYVFYTMFLLLAVYTAVRFVQSDRDRWLWMTMILLGACIGDRPSEAFVLPAFAGLWLSTEPRPRIGARRLLLSICLIALPFAISVGSLIVRSDPSRIANRDDYARDRILGEASVNLPIGIPADAPVSARLADAVAYGLGLVWATSTAEESSLDRSWLTLRKTAWLFSGAGAWGRALYPGESINPELRGGTSIGLPGLVLALIGTVAWRRQRGWLLLGWGIFLGNLAFVLWYYRWDNLTFTVPGTVGLAFLAGLGAAALARPGGSRRRGAALACAALLVPALLLATNAPYATWRTRYEEGVVQWTEQVATTPWPRDSVILSTYWPTMTLRYILYVESGRRDVAAIQSGRANWGQLIDHYNAEGRPVFIPRASARPQDLPEFLKDTPREIYEAGYVRIRVVPEE